MRVHDWASLGATLAVLTGVALLATGRTEAGLVCALGGLCAAAMARASSRRLPGPMPYALRWVLYLPRGPLAAARLRTILEPAPGERVLEIGPGVGIYSLPIAQALAPDGRLDAIDIQRDMLAALATRARRADVRNIATAQGDAQHLAYDDGIFDAAFLVGVLGEIPDPSAALRELRRVLRPTGRLVVGEMLFGDPDAIAPATLRKMVEAAGFVFERRQGPWLCYFARFRPAAVSPAHQ
jgi:SAM-dependent methyltransferase